MIEVRGAVGVGLLLFILAVVLVSCFVGAAIHGGWQI